MPVSVVFNYNDGVYAIDSDPNKADAQDKNILIWMVIFYLLSLWFSLKETQGTLLEKYLTTPTQEFSSYLRSNPLPPCNEDIRREAYRYAKVYILYSSDFCKLSTLDSHKSL